MKKLNFVFIALLTCLFISCKPTVDTYPCPYCGELYFTVEEAEACSCTTFECEYCHNKYHTEAEAKNCLCPKFACEYCNEKYQTEAEAEACSCTTFECENENCPEHYYHTKYEADTCSKHIGCPHGYLSEEAEEKYTYISGSLCIPIMSSGTKTCVQDLKNAQKLYKEICDYVKTSNDFDDSYKNLCTLDFSNVTNVGVICSDPTTLNILTLGVSLNNNNMIVYQNTNGTITITPITSN